jgi:hypothetical protein
MKRDRDFGGDRLPVLARTDSSVLVVEEHKDLPAGAKIRVRPNVVLEDALLDKTQPIDLNQAGRLATALAAAAKELDAERGKEGSDAWPDQVKKAAKASVKRLSTRSDALSKLALSTARVRQQNIADDADWARQTILGTRYAEHKRVYALAHP